MDGKMFHFSDDTNAWSLETLKHRMEENECKTLIVDYLQLLNIDHEENYDSRSSALCHEMERLSLYARSAQCRVIVLSMISRCCLEQNMNPGKEVFSQLWGTCPEEYNYHILVSDDKSDTCDSKNVTFISVTGDISISLLMDKNTEK